MHRRLFLLAAASLFCCPSVAWAVVQRFACKVKTKSGNIVDNISIYASDVEAAKVKLMKKYPGCTILSVRSKPV